MTKTKKIIIAALALLLLAAILSGVLFGVRLYKKRHPAGLERSTLPNGHGKKATVILLAGQSNAAGCSHDEYLKLTSTPEKYAEYEAGYDNVYINFFTSGTNESRGFVKCKARQGEAVDFYGFGPELGLAEKLYEERPDEMFFIIKYAWGGTDLARAWAPPSSEGETGSLYNSLVEFTRQSIAYLEAKNYDVSIEAMCWMQGEADSLATEDAAAYEENLENLISDIRRDLSEFADEDGIAFVDAAIAEGVIFWQNAQIINEAKRTVAERSPLNVFVDTAAAGLTTLGEPQPDVDIAHYDSQSEIKLGHLFAEAVSRFLK